MVDRDARWGEKRGGEKVQELARSIATAFSAINT